VRFDDVGCLGIAQQFDTGVEAVPQLIRILSQRGR
jgi:hypothetical protein